MPHLQHAPVTRLDRRNQGAPWRGPTRPTIKGRGKYLPPWGNRARPAGLSAIFRNWLDWLGRLDTTLKINGLLRPTPSGARGRLARSRDHAALANRFQRTKRSIPASRLH